MSQEKNPSRKRGPDHFPDSNWFLNSNPSRILRIFDPLPFSQFAKKKNKQAGKYFPNTLTLPLPRDDDDAVDEGVLAEVDHPDGVLDVVVVEVGAVPQVRVQLAVDCQRAVAVAPLLPRVTLVVHPSHLVEGLVGN